MPVAVDLFSGAGGLSLGLTAAGMRIAFAAESWDVAVRTYRANFDHPCVEVDLSRVTASELWALSGASREPLDLVAGGPPCQGFSIQRIGADRDERNSLVLEFGRLVRELRPRMFLMENVPGLLGKRGRTLAALFGNEMALAGYDTNTVHVNAADFGIPQVRRRVFYFGWLRNVWGAPFRFPPHPSAERPRRTVWDVIGDLPSPPDDFTPQPGDDLHRRTRLSALNLTRIRHVPPGGGMEDLPQHLRVDCHKAGAERIGHRFVYGRMSPHEPAPTITARFDSFTRGKFGHPFEPRSITLREGARLQTFPDAFRFLGTQEENAALIGNAVPPLLAEVVGRAARSFLEGDPLGVMPAPNATRGPLHLFSQERG